MDEDEDFDESEDWSDETENVVCEYCGETYEQYVDDPDGELAFEHMNECKNQEWFPIKWTADGSTTLREAIEALQGLVDALKAQHDDGWELEGEVDNGHFRMAKRAVVTV